MDQLDWNRVAGAIFPETAASDSLKTLLCAVGEYEKRAPAAFVIFEDGRAALPRAHSIWKAPCLYAAEVDGALQYLGVASVLGRRVRAASGCASHQHLGPLIKGHRGVVVYAIPTVHAQRRWYDTLFIGLFPHMSNKSANPKEHEARHAARVRLILARIHAEPGILKTAVISRMGYGTGEHILERLEAQNEIHSVAGTCRETGNPTLRYYPGGKSAS